MNNALANRLESLVERAKEDWDRSTAVMLKTPYIACQEAVPLIIRQGGG